MNSEDEVNPSRKPTRSQNIFAISFTVFALLLVGVGGFLYRQHTVAGRAGSSKAMAGGTMREAAGAAKDSMAPRTVNGVTVSFSQTELRNGKNEFTVEFKNAKGEYVDVGDVKFPVDMNMPGMMMHADSRVTPTGKPGRYKAVVTPQMAGDWQAKLTFNGKDGRGEATFPINVK